MIALVINPRSKDRKFSASTRSEKTMMKKEGFARVALFWTMVLGYCFVLNEAKRDLCCGVVCPRGEQCSVVYTENANYTAICGPDPCIGYKCCNGRGGICEKDGCYLMKTGPYRVCPVCLDSCRRNKVKCKVPGEFCYTTKFVCTTAPCNPVPQCRRPCHVPIVDVCDLGYKCEVMYENCVSNPKSPFYDPYCKPLERCVRTCHRG